MIQKKDINRAITADILVVLAFVLAAKLVAAGKEVVVAHRYGAGALVDGYLFVFNISQWPASVFASVTAVVLIPYIVRLHAQDPAAAARLQAVLFSLSVLLGVICSFVYGMSMFWVVSQLDLGFTVTGQSAALICLPFITPVIALVFVGATVSNWLMSERRHISTLLEAVPAILIAASVLIMPIDESSALGVFPLALGTLLGFSFQAFLLMRTKTQKFSYLHVHVITLHWPALRRAIYVMSLAQLIITSSTMIEQFIAVRMGEGILATYSYALRIMALVLGLTSVAISRATLPIFSSVSDARDSLELCKRWANIFGAVGIIGTIILYTNAEALVSLLFQRGAFTEADTAEVAEILRILSTQLPFYLYSIVLIQWLAAIQKTTFFLISAIAGLAAKGLGMFIFFQYGALGLAASSTVMHSIVALTVYISSLVIIRAEFRRCEEKR